MYMPRRRKCAACRDWFTPSRTNVRYCSPACKQRAYRARSNPHRWRASVSDCDWNHETDKAFASVTAIQQRRHAATWQLDEALRLADEFALCRSGASPTEISRRMLTRVRAVAKRWRAVASELKQHKQASR